MESPVQVNTRATTREDFKLIIKEIRSIFNIPTDFVPLHQPYFGGNEKKYLSETIDSTFVSSVGAFVDRFETMMQDITGAKFAIATTNGTSALHLSLLVAGVKPGDEVITQALTFIATPNAISHAQASPVFIDVDKQNMGLSPQALRAWFEANVSVDQNNKCINKITGKRVSACIPMHSFGFPLYIEEIVKVCDEYHVPVVEDAAESLGSYVGLRHTGTFGLMGTFSFNGNKTVTCGGGGVIITNDEHVAKLAKHLSTTAKIPHKWEFAHDAVAYNYRLPNLNAALACAQLEQLEVILANKRNLSLIYKDFFAGKNIEFVEEREGTIANYWLNSIILPSKAYQQEFLKYSNDSGVMTRPVWQLSNQLSMYLSCQHDGLSNSLYLADRVVNIPSSYRP